MEEEKLIEIEGWLTLDSDGYVYFHDGEPYIKKVTVEDFNPEHRKRVIRLSWSNNQNFECLGHIRNFPELVITSEKPERVKLQIVLSC